MTTLHFPCLSVATNSNSHFLLRVNYLDSVESYGAQLQVSPEIRSSRRWGILAQYLARTVYQKAGIGGCVWYLAVTLLGNIDSNEST